MSTAADFNPRGLYRGYAESWTDFLCPKDCDLLWETIEQAEPEKQEEVYESMGTFSVPADWENGTHVFYTPTNDYYVVFTPTEAWLEDYMSREPRLMAVMQ